SRDVRSAELTVARDVKPFSASMPHDPIAAPRSDCYRMPIMDALPATEITSLLGRGTRFEGKLYFEGRVRIDGVFKGEIKSDDTLIIGDGAAAPAELHGEHEII